MTADQLRELLDALRSTAIEGQPANVALIVTLITVVCFTLVALLAYRGVVKHFIPLTRQFLETFKSLSENVKGLSITESDQLAVLREIKTQTDSLTVGMQSVKLSIEMLPEATKKRIEPMFADFLRDVAAEIVKASQSMPNAPRQVIKKTGLRGILASFLMGGEMLS